MTGTGEEKDASAAASPPASRRFALLRIVQGRPRLLAAIAFGIGLGFALPADWRVITRLLLGWNGAAWLYFLLAALMILGAPQEAIKRRAEMQEDAGRYVVLIMASFAGLAAIGAIIAHLAAVKGTTGPVKGLHIGLAAATIFSAWTFIHLIYALHYAHDYFLEREATARRPAKDAGGLHFPGTKNPDYFDFLYFSFVIGVACQTADVEISSQSMRRAALAHCVLAFFFNSAVLALTINIAASLVVYKRMSSCWSSRLHATIAE